MKMYSLPSFNVLMNPLAEGVHLIVWNAEARKQVQMMTERMGGEYSPDLHVNCTHLVVQISF